jgi:formylglycine-generating enzyme required for sulfatase activity/serine/threonine protein kinase
MGDKEMAEQLLEQLGRYTIIKRLGQGGMGSVYLAEDTQLGRRVALKVPDFGPHEGPEARKRFLGEARTAATLDHPYLCPVHDAGEIGGKPFLTMAYIEGQSLAALIGDEGWPERQVAALVGKLALAMQEAHKKKVIHRDLKPANVMIKTTGQRREPVIVDFGLAHRDNPEEQRLTRSGQIMGTLGYMAPEQVRGDLKEIGPACDIYALGVILYELLTGRLPFSGSGLAVAGQILTVTPLPPSTHRSDLDPTLEAICLKAMAKQVGDRYTSMGELAAALTGFLRSPSATPTPTSPASSSPTPGVPPQPAGSNSLVGRFLDQLAENKASPPPVSNAEPDASPAPHPEGRRSPWSLIVAAGVLGALLLGVIIYVATDKGRIRMVVNDPKAVIKIDGEEVRMEALGAPITLRAGEHALEVGWGDGEFKTRRFVVRRGGNVPLHVEYEATDKAPSTADRKKSSSPVEQPGLEETKTDTKPSGLLNVTTPTAVSPLPAVSVEPPKQITNSIGMKLVLIPAGEFMMGSSDDVKEAGIDEKPRHRVRITRPFYLGATEVTQSQYRAVTGQSPSHFTGSDDLPVENISWKDAITFCDKLSEQEKGQLGSARYRLPTEAEWEYACRGGSTTRYGFGDDAARLGEFAWYEGNSGGKTHRVGETRPNAWNLYDMHGNVWEWCQDWYDKDYYGQSPDADPPGPLQATFRLCRGGCWDFYPQGCRAAYRLRRFQSLHGSYLGFRLARDQSSR